MPIFEIQVMSGGRWKARDAFDDQDAAYEYAARIERTHHPEQLRIRRTDLSKSGSPRERTVYEGGRKAQRTKAAERKREEQDAFRQRIADRRIRRIAAENAARKNRVFSSNSPVYLTLVSLCIGLTGLSAMYLVEKVFTS